ncbi:MAG: peptide chain release factor N(5)-glutamine methyltransferase [Treponema sp.]|nr:peptide chain release factor N(5)-glutamine methyltransferase [Treponema sp.]
MTIQEFKNKGLAILKEKSPSPSLDIEVLLENILSCDKTQILLNRDKEIPQDKIQWLNQALEKRSQGLPIAYITGHKEFYGYDFYVSPAVLIPKADTEILVERAIEIIIEKMDNRANSILTICDMCSGSGCIGLSVIKNLIEEYKIPEEKLPKFTLVDISQEALEISKINAQRIKLPLDRLRFIQSNLFDLIPWDFDIILTNPPYIPAKMVDQLLMDNRSEPRLALDGDVTINGEAADSQDGLEIIRNLLPQAKEHLCRYGNILLESGEYNAQAAAKIAQDLDFKTKIHKDLEGQLRLIEIW